MSVVKKFCHEYVEFSPKSVSRFLESCPLDEVVAFLDSLDTDGLKLLLPQMNSYLVGSFLLQGQNSAPESLNYLSDVHAAAVLSGISESQRKPILERIDHKKRLKIGRLISFIPGSAGSVMDSAVLPVQSSDTVKSCAASISGGGRHDYYIYVVSEENILIGVTTMRRVFEMKNSLDPILTIMDEHVNTIRVDDSTPEVLANPGWDDNHAMPVVDYHGKLLGVIRYSTLKSMQKRRHINHGKNEAHLTGTELGELYSLGFSAFLGGTGSVAKEMSKDYE